MPNEAAETEAVAEREPMTETETPKKSGFFNNLSIRNKLVALLTVFGLTPAIILFVILELQGGPFHRVLSQGLAINATKMMDVIERNLFERYGDVQAFGLNTAAQNPANWGNPIDSNPLVNAMNGYMTGC